MIATRSADPANRGPQPFRVEIADGTLERIRDRVRAFRWDAVDELPGSGDWSLGPPTAYLRDLCGHWAEEYDWRTQEREINATPHYLVDVDGLDLHVVHERGSGPSPTPLLLAHGWPYSFHSFHRLIDRLAHPERHGGRAEDAFDVVVPSYPGYDFSARPSSPMGPRAVAFAFDTLMSVLGHDRYVVHGGDWGAHVASLLGFHRADRIAGVHLTAVALRDASAPQLTGQVAADASAEEKGFVADEAQRWRREGAYSALHATKPAKLAFGMADSPVGVAAWIIEAFHAWSDRRASTFDEIFARDDLLTEVMLYLVTDAFPTSTWIYSGKQHEEAALPAGRRVEVPTAIAAFPDPVFPVPPRSVAEKSHHVVRYTDMPRGGHFPFYETPDLLVDDLLGFGRQLQDTPAAGPGAR